MKELLCYNISVVIGSYNLRVLYGEYISVEY